MPRNYVDNAYNRSVGRVGMSHGSAVVSRSSGGGGSSYGGSVDSSRSSGQYVDNSQNCSLGRVGMDYGTAVHSRSSTGGASSIGCSSTTSGQYVDNSHNRSLGRVGMAYGTAVESKSSGGGYSTASSTKTYVDNSANQLLGRVGLPLGSAVVSKSDAGNGSRSTTRSSMSTSSYVDNELNRQLGRVGLGKGTAIFSKSSPSAQAANKTYVDNAYNSHLGRVGMPWGTATQSSTKAVSAAVKTYVDNALNRRLGRVGKQLGTMPVTKAKPPPCFYQNCDGYNFDDIWDKVPKEYQTDYYHDEMEALFNLKRARKDMLPQGQKLPIQPNQIIDFDKLKLGEKIGNGGFGDVHVAIWNGNQVAVKKLRVQRVSQTKKKQFEDEVLSFSKLDHPYIVKFYGACLESPNLAIVMEFLPDGSLYDNIHCLEVQFEDSLKNSFIVDLYSALSYLHTKGMVHRDIKSKNIMLFDNKTHCKLADFGLALKDDTATSSTVRSYGFAGTEKYSANEVLEGQKLTVSQLKASDVYSLALTTVELLTEKEPFDGQTGNQIRAAKMKGEIPTLDGCGILSKIKNLLKVSLAKEPVDRPSAELFLKHFKNILELE